MEGGGPLVTAYEQIHAAYQSAAYNSLNPAPRANRLYADLWLAWGDSRVERSQRIGALLQKLSMRLDEITPEQDADMRKEAGL
jgi:hypothetical protein